jgi:hypothetical protein
VIKNIHSSLDPIIMGQYMGYNLAAPISFWDASDETITEVVGGCGPGGIGDIIVPDKIWGLNIKPACKIHDWTFFVWNDKQGFDLSNNLFKNNMVRINEQHNGWGWVKRRRLKAIKLYYDMVQTFGESSYYGS